MTLPSGALRRQGDASGSDLALITIQGKDYPVVVMAGPGGHLEGSLPTYTLAIPPQAVGASKLHFDLFNGSAAGVVKVRGIWVIVAQDVAVTGLVSVRMDWLRTSAVGTGGTAAAYNGSAIAPNIVPKDTSNAALPAGLTARAAPTGGATSAAWLFPTYHQTEETSMAGAVSQWENVLPNPERGEQELTLRPGFGLKGVQGAVAGVGTLGFLASFTVE